MIFILAHIFSLVARLFLGFVIKIQLSSLEMFLNVPQQIMPKYCFFNYNFTAKSHFYNLSCPTEVFFTKTLLNVISWYKPLSLLCEYTFFLLIVFMISLLCCSIPSVAACLCATSISQIYLSDHLINTHSLLHFNNIQLCYLSEK